MKKAFLLWLGAKWAQWTRYDLKGDLQMQERAAWRDVEDSWREYLTPQPCEKCKNELCDLHNLMAELLRRF